MQRQRHMARRTGYAPRRAHSADLPHQSPTLLARAGKIDPLRAERALDVLEQDLHGANVGDVVALAPGEDMSDDGVRAILHDPGARVATDCSAVSLRNLKACGSAFLPPKPPATCQLRENVLRR